MADLTEDTIVCASCGRTVPRVAIVCPFCNSTDPRGRRVASTPIKTPPVGYRLELPGWEFIAFPADGELELGRDAADESVFAALAPFVDVSRHHAKLMLSPTGIQVEDLGAENGTWLGETRLTEFQPVPIEAGQRLRLASCCYVRVTVTNE